MQNTLSFNTPVPYYNRSMMNDSELWAYMEKLRSTRSRNRKEEILAKLMDTHTATDVFYAFRLLTKNPLMEADDNMGVGKKTVRKAAVEAYNRTYEEIREAEKTAGNLSDVFADLEPREGLVKDETERRNYPIDELWDELYTVSQISSDKRKIAKIASLLSTSKCPQVVSFGILGDISVGASEKSILKMLSKSSKYSREMLDRAYGINPDIGQLAKSIVMDDVPRTEILPYDRIVPQKASATDLPQDTEGWLGQYKYDGARVLIHGVCGFDKSGGDVTTVQAYPEYRIFSRRRNEVTDNLPEVEEIEWPLTDFIVDAEALGYDPETGEVLNYQKTMERFQREKNIEEKREEVEIRFKLFDLLYIDDEDLTCYPYYQRWNKLRDNFPEEMIAESNIDLEQCYSDAIDDGHEGIIAKDMAAHYVFDRDKSWRKVKPVKEPIELRISGAIRGTGRLADSLGAINVETADEHYVGKVGTGFSDGDREQLWELHMADDLIGRIVELEFEELQKTDNGYGLRFPRFSTLRPEGEADTLERLKNL